MSENFIDASRKFIYYQNISVFSQPKPQNITSIL